METRFRPDCEVPMSTATIDSPATTVAYLIEGPAAATQVPVRLDAAGLPPAVIGAGGTAYARDRRRALGPVGALWVYVLQR